MRGHIYMATKPYLRGAGYPHREQLKEMLIKQQEAKIKEIKPEKDLDDRYEGEFYPEPEEMGHPPKPKLWYLIAVLKKPAFL